MAYVCRPPRLSEPSHVITATGLTRYYGSFPALQDVSFTVEPGQIVGLLGRNGAGKSTAFKILAGLMPPSSGTVTIDGVDITNATDSFKARIGYLPERPPLYDDMTVTSFLTHLGRLKGMSGAEITERLPQVVTLAALQGREHQVIGTLSHGFRKRVGIAQAVLHDPKLVILDEPISGLDPKQIAELRPVIRSLGEGRVVFVSSHILTEVSQTCDRILVLNDGKLVADDSETALASRLNTHRVSVTVRGEASSLDRWLSERIDVEEHDVTTTKDGYAKARITLTGDVRESLVAGLVAAGFGLRLLDDPMDELEEIFLGLTEGDQ